MFTQACFIRNNNVKLFNTLQELGYKHQQCFVKPYRDLLVVNNGYYSINFPYGSNNEGFIDCGTNEDLFLALSALRDDSDKFQWFTDGINWAFCDSNKFGSYWTRNDFKINLDTIHKATVKELIEHFKDK